MKPVVRIRYINFFDGFDDQTCRTNVLMDLCDEFDFVFSGTPDIVLVGCYSQQSLQPCNALKVGYYTENLAPDLVNFDYFFGCEYTNVIRNPKYCKRIYGPLQADLIGGCADPERALREKNHFANFVYSTSVPFRERFFTELQQYRPVSAPGRSMNNTSDISTRTSNDWRGDKLAYLRKFKFTVAFENSRRCGYATEKLYDALQADTVPIYWGDPTVENVINPAALIIVDSDWERDVLAWLALPESRVPFRPYIREQNFTNKLFGRGNDWFRRIRASIPYRKGFRAAIEEVIVLDRNDEAYVDKLSQPRLNPYVRKLREEYFAFWRGIINRAILS